MRVINHSDFTATMTVVRFDSGIELLYSYETLVAAFVPGHGVYKTSHKWSVTTSKHISKYIGYVGQAATVKEVHQDTLEKMFDITLTFDSKPYES